MAFRKWEVVQTCFCSHVEQDVDLESELVYPSDFLSDQNPRVLGHRCSKGMMCNQFSESACVWAGTNPTYDPFQV